MTREQAAQGIFGLFCSAVVLTNAVSGMLVHVGPFVVVPGTLLYPVTFLLTDVLSEVYGKEVAKRAVWTGFIAQAIAVVFVQLVALLPAHDCAVGEAWRTVFMPMARLVVASMAAFLCSQLVDVRVFHAVRERTGRKHLWLRNNIATSIAQAVDTIVFVSVAFIGSVPLRALLLMVLGQYVVKVVLAALDTPLCYLAVWWVRGRPAGGST